MALNVADVPLLFFCLSSISALLNISLLGFVFKQGLYRTMLMKQVVSLCFADMGCYLWEMFSCNSFCSRAVVCFSARGCWFNLWWLRTFQIASALWTVTIAVGIYMNVRRVSLAPFRFIHAVWPIAVLFASPFAFFSVDGPGGTCNPSSVWLNVYLFIVHLMCLLVILVSYLGALKHISLMSTAAVLRRTMNRAMVYVIFYAVTWLPYMIVQVLNPAATEDDVMSRVENQICYSVYFLSGACNVLAYGVHHWDTSCGRSRRDQSSHGARMVTFPSDVTSFRSSHTTSTTGSSKREPWDPNADEMTMLVDLQLWCAIPSSADARAPQAL
eukprot:TRINITY_DN2705_c0_g1_i1.p1 TRINITY_DN2705_c0_g1~~TRINITY_DN2705_c0_g1_i1.p1  ORF type:complete len:328 (-),score=26.04 TRINITY_DN2705_c0_g1_i1:97-1080(-)